MAAPMRRAAGLAAAAAVVYGGWAVWANLAYGAARAARAGLAQGGLSLAATFGSALVLERLFRVRGPLLARAALAALGTQALVLGVMASVHAAAGTPEIASTLAPVAAVGAVYFSTYAGSLAAAEHRAAARPPTPPSGASRAAR